MNVHRRILYACCLAALAAAAPPVTAQRTAKPVLHGRHWVAITGKPLGATAGAMMFQKGGNAVDAACAMLAAVTTMWDVLSWGGETQALIYNPRIGKVIGIDALGVAPAGATPELFRGKGMAYPPEYGPLAALTPGTPGGLMTMLAEYGTLSLKDVLEPAIQMADGYPIEAETANSIERSKERIKQWKYSRAVYLTHPGEKREAPYAGEVFRQPDLAATLRKLVEAEQQALKGGKSRKEAISAAYDRFYKGDIAREFVRGVQEEGGLITLDDLAGWKVRIEEPVTTTYRGVQVYKLTHWTQGPAMLQALNILENFDLKAMGYNSARYVHALYQAMNLAFADRDFYYGDPYFPPEEPIAGLLSKQYAKARAQAINWERNDPNAKPGDPYPFMGKTNPYRQLLESWPGVTPATGSGGRGGRGGRTTARSRRRSSGAPRRSRRPTSRAGWSRSPPAVGGSRR
jgi:gamma-glutamyltranspeptidase / glutathione hydrolase